MKWSLGNRSSALATVVLLAAALASGCAGSHRTVQSTPAVPAAEPTADRGVIADGVHHTVRPGQTLWRIATTYGLTVDELARANRIEDPTRIDVGDRLFIPGASTVLEIPAVRVGTVAAGDWIWPVAGGRILSYYGAPRRNRRHTGVDIRGEHGAHVRAVEEGVVVYSGSSMRGYGKTVILDHGRGLRTLYAHNSSLGVKKGQRVRQGETIARVGRSGNASTEHCHFEVRRDDVAVDPLRFVSPGFAGGAGRGASR